MSAITNIISEIDSIQTVLSTLRSNVLNFLKSEEPLVPKKEGENRRRLHLQHLNQQSILPRPLYLYLSVRPFHLFQLLLHFLRLPRFPQLVQLQPPLRIVHLQTPL